MPITRTQLIPYRLPLDRHWVSAQGSFSERRGWLVRLSDEDGHVGIGDCAPLHQAGTEIPERAEQWLTTALSQIKGCDPEEALARLESPEPAPPAAHCGLETALVDLLAKRADLSLAQWLNPEAATEIRVSVNLGLLDGTTIERLDQVADYSVIKLKLGVAPIEQELALLEQLAERLARGVTLRLDANRAWNRQEAARLLAAVESLPIESIEEPLSKPSPDALHELQDRTAIPLTLDESLTVFDIDNILQKPPVARLILKPMVLGGPRPGLALAQQAYDAGMACVVTTTVDSAVGVWAATHLAAALGEHGQEIAHGLATSSWLAEDVANGPVITNGLIALGDEPGLGLLVSGC